MNYYQILGIDNKAPIETIKKVFRQLAVKFHPDKNKNSNAVTKMQEINAAYAVLRDVNKRAKYDRSLIRPKKAPPKNPYEDSRRAAQHKAARDQSWNDLTDPISGWEFGHGFANAFGINLEPIKGADIRADITISYTNARNGCRHQLKLIQITPCWHCNGQSAIYDWYTCELCSNVGEINTEKVIEILVPAGVTNGQILRIKGQGYSHDADIAGDLYVSITVQSPENKQKEYKHLGKLDAYIQQNISLRNAYKGSQIFVTGPCGKVKMKIESKTFPGKIYRLRHQGHYNSNNGEIGDLYVEIQVDYPKKPTDNDWIMINELNLAIVKNPQSND